MKKLLLAGVGLLALGVTAASAADLPRREVMPTKAPAYAPPPVYNWTGFYLGINGGGAFGKSEFEGLLPSGSSNVSGGLVGGTIGYNWQIGQTVLGLEGDMDWASIRGSSDCAGFSCDTRNDWLGTARGRLGYAFDRWMPFVTGGAAFGNIKSSIAGIDTDTTKVGWTAGGGIEAAVGGPWTVKVEYLYVDLGHGDTNLGTDAKFRTNIVRAGLNYRF